MPTVEKLNFFAIMGSMKNESIYYSVGALLYCPANKQSLSDSIINEKFGKKYSLAMCLEDSINDNFVEEAEKQLVDTLRKIHESREECQFYVPKIFIRVRNHEQITRLYSTFGDEKEIIAGFIVPKFSLDNSEDYINSIAEINEASHRKVFLMPIYESSSIIDLRTRFGTLYTLKERLSQIEELVLNIRVGGNDLCHNFGFRRHSDESIHRIKPISDIFSDIVTVYGTDYIVSGPVWEYYSGENWKEGLIQEIKDDQLCGFTGKTVIHPNQISVVNEAYKVCKEDYEDAKSILSWNSKTDDYVLGSRTKERMNEYKTHTNWARKTLFLAEEFGIKDCD